MSAKPNYIICIPIADCKVANSERVICSHCEAICGLSPATKDNASRYGEYKIICASCFIETMGDDKDKIMPITPEQIQEMKDATETDFF